MLNEWQYRILKEAENSDTEWMKTILKKLLPKLNFLDTKVTAKIEKPRGVGIYVNFKFKSKKYKDFEYNMYSSYANYRDTTVGKNFIGTWRFPNRVKSSAYKLYPDPDIAVKRLLKFFKESEKLIQPFLKVK